MALLLYRSWCHIWECKMESIGTVSDQFISLVRGGRQKCLFNTSSRTKANVHSMCFLKSLTGANRSADTQCLLQKIGQVPLYSSSWFGWLIRFWNSPWTISNSFMSKVNEADLLHASKKGSWTFHNLSAVISCSKNNRMI